MQNKSYYGIMIFLLWSGFLVLTGGIVFLSLQDGGEAKEMMKSLMEYMSRYVDKNMITGLGDPQRLEYLLRQGGRAVAFFLLGMIGTSAVHFSFRKCNWLVKTALSITGLIAIAYFTEKVKEYLPTRHFSEKEMLISIIFVIAGFLVVTMVTFLAWIIKGLTTLLQKGI